MPLSTVPMTGPTIPSGAKSVSIKTMDTTASTKKEVVTDLLSEEVEYADPVLVDGGAATATATCSASGNMKDDTVLAVTSVETTTGWICEDIEISYEVGKYASWSANWSYYPEEE